MIDLDTTRVAANRNRTPDGIWFILCMVASFSMVDVGYQFGLTGARNWAVTIILVFPPVIVLIADLDRRQAGLLQVSQQALIDLLRKIGTPVP